MQRLCFHGSRASWRAATRALVCVVAVACTQKPPGEGAGDDDDEAKPAPRVTLPDEGGDEPPEPLRPTLAQPGTDPYAETDAEVTFEVPEDLPSAPAPAPGVAPVAAPERSRPGTRELWDEYANVRALAGGTEAIYFADMMGLGGKVVSKIRAVPLAGGEAQVVVADQGRVDAIALGGEELAWVALPAEGDGPPALWARPLSAGSDDGASEPRLVDGKYGTANHLARVGDAFMFVLPVTQQGRSGGLARVSAGGDGSRLGIGKSLGPAFSPVTHEGRVYFMAHARGGPDVIYSVDATGKDVKAHVSMPRGVFAIALDDTHLYWAKIGGDGRSTELGRVRRDGSGPPTGLGTVSGVVFETMVVARDALWLGTSPASSTGQVVRVPTTGITADTPPQIVFEAPRIWHVFAAGADDADERRVIVHVERPGDDGNAHRVFIELR